MEGKLILYIIPATKSTYNIYIYKFYSLFHLNSQTAV